MASGTAVGWGRRLLVEPPRPGAIRDHPGAPWFAVATVCAGAFLGQFDASVVTVALPAMRSDLHTSLAAAQWVALGYLLALVAALPVVGWLSDRVGRKALYTYGFGVFALASAGCGLASNLEVLVGLRVVQGLGAALLQANSVALVVTTLPSRSVARGLGVQGAAQALGLALGPVLGSVLVAAVGWRWVFLVNVPLGLLGTLLGWLFLPRTRDRRADESHLDVAGAVLLALATGLLLVALSLLTAGHGLGAGAPAGVALLAVGGFILRERMTSDPLVDLGALRREGSARPLAAGLVAQLVLFGLLFAVPQLVAGPGGTGGHGLLLAALPAALGEAAPLAGRWAGRSPVAARWLPVAGAGLLAAGTAVALPGAAHPVLLVAGLLAAGFGVGLLLPVVTSRVVSRAAGRVGRASGLVNVARGLGTSLGVGVTTSLLGLGGVAAATAGLAALALIVGLLARP